MSNLSNDSVGSKDPRLNFLMRRMALAYEGFQISHSYTTTQINTHLRYEAKELMNSYWRVFRDNANELLFISQRMEFIIRTTEGDQ